MKSIRILAGGVVAAALVCVAPAANAGLQGQTVHLDRVIPSYGFDYDTAVNQSGDIVAGVSPPLALSTGNNMSVGVGDNNITYDFGPLGGLGGVADAAITFSEASQTISGVSVFSTSLPTLSGFNASDFTFDAHDVSLNIGAFNWSPGDNQIVLQLQFASAAPEPATWAMLILGLGMIGFAARRRRAATAAVLTTAGI